MCGEEWGGGLKTAEMVKPKREGFNDAIDVPNHGTWAPTLPRESSRRVQTQRGYCVYAVESPSPEDTESAI